MDVWVTHTYYGRYLVGTSVMVDLVTLKLTYCNTPTHVRHQCEGTTIAQCTHQGILSSCSKLKSPLRPIMDSHTPIATKIE